MSRELLQSIIVNFDLQKLKRFFSVKNNKFRPREESFSYYNSDNFYDGLKLGELSLEDGSLLVSGFRVLKELSERSGKKAQYDLGKRILKETQNDAGIFIFYNQKGSFRFSLIYANYLGKKRDWSTFRRFTYFVGNDLTNKTFKQRIGDSDFSSLEKIKEAFSVEKVTKDFYQDIANWYFWAVQNSKFPKDAEEEDNGRNIAVIRLITRMIFIWFMRERGLIPKDLFNWKEINNILKDTSPEKTTYYMAILQNLFFATLNTKRNIHKDLDLKKEEKLSYGEYYGYHYHDLFKDSSMLKDYFGKIPFLNGGLFECLDDESNAIIIDGFSDNQENQPLVPNKLFFLEETEVDLNVEYGTKNKSYKARGLINTLSLYNFTIDENELDDQEVALDPELLGRVFENLLASFNPETSTTARKATGSYYTPREIVDYMVTESLKAYFKTHLSEIPNLDKKIELLFSKGSENNPFIKSESKKIVELIESVKIIDPAVGSGAFPMGALNKMVFILNKVDPGNELWEQAQLDAAEAIPDPQVRRNTKEQIEVFFKDKNADYGRKLYLIQKSIYGVDIQQIAVEIAKLRFFISLLVDEKLDKEKEDWGIQPLPNLDFKIMQGNSLVSEFLGIDFDNGQEKQKNSEQESFNLDDEYDDLIKDFEQKKTDYQNESDKNKKAILKTKVEDLMLELFEAKLQNKYSELKSIEEKAQAIPNLKTREEYIKSEKEKFSNKHGLDLENIEKQLREFISKKKTRPFFPWKLYFAEVFNKDCPGFDIVIANPPYEEISSKTEKLFFQNNYKEVLSGHYDLFIFFLKKGIDLLKKDGINVFITPHTFIIYSQFQKLRNWLYYNNSIIEITDRVESIFETAVVDNSISIIAKGTSITKTKFSKYIYTGNELKLKAQVQLDKNKYTPEAFEIDTIQNKEILKKFEINSSQLGDVVESSQGITVYAKVQGKKINYFREKVESINTKPYTKGREIFKYNLQWQKRYIEYGDWLWCPRDKKFFINPKIFLRQTSADIIATYVEKPFYCIDSVHSLIKKNNGPELKYVLAILNSKFGNYLYHLLISEEDKVFAQVKLNFLRKIPIKKGNEKVQTPFIKIVDKILAITETNDYLENPSKKEKVKVYEKQIDQMVYKLYDLSPEEIEIVEHSVKK